MTTALETFKDALGRAWWIVLLRGILSLVFGIVALIWPQLSLAFLVAVYAAYALVDGVLSVGAAIRGGGISPRWWLAVGGLISIAAGVAALIWPGLTALVLIVLIGAVAIARGIFEIVGAIQLRKSIDNEWVLILSGGLSVLFGLLVIIAPGAGALALAWLIGLWAAVIGILLIALSLRLRKLKIG